MGYHIPKAPEAGRWAAGLNAHVHDAWRSAPSWLGKIGFWAARPGLDAADMQHRVMLTRVRRAVADVATSRKRLELRIGELERQADDLADPSRETTDVGQDRTADQDHTTGGLDLQLAELRRQYADMQAKEDRVTAASQRLMAEVKAFRAGKEATKAAYTSAEQAADAVWNEMNQ